MLFTQMDAVWAEEFIRDGRHKDLNATAYKELVLIATGSEKEANAAFSKRRLDELSHGEK